MNNKFGAKWTLFAGTFGYALYVGSYLCIFPIRVIKGWYSCQFVRAINIHSNAGGFVIGAGAFLGVTAALLWTAQGSLMLSYPTEGQKGIFISIFWGIFNLGAVVGSSVSFGQNFKSTVRSFVFNLRLSSYIPTVVRIIVVCHALETDMNILTSNTVFPSRKWDICMFFFINSLTQPNIHPCV